MGLQSLQVQYPIRPVFRMRLQTKVPSPPYDIFVGENPSSLTHLTCNFPKSTLQVIKEKKKQEVIITHPCEMADENGGVPIRINKRKCRIFAIS